MQRLVRCEAGPLEQQPEDARVGLQAAGVARRQRGLEPSGDPGRPGTQRLKSGYNPYNSGPLGKQSWKKKKDLRELSRWIELRRKVTHGPSGDGDSH